VPYKVALLGETGVGKSTMITALANYCSFESLEEAESTGGLFPIDQQTRSESTTHVGKSVTQEPQEYVFAHKNMQIVIIDTPGLLATEDVGTSRHDKDKEHVENIFKLLSKHVNIHAICILMKATENRLSNAFQYTLSEFLRRLDANARNNVIFIFTHAASTNFKPHTAQSVLQLFLQKYSLSLPLNKSTVYCFENNIVQYLKELQTETSTGDKEYASINWKRSVESTDSMLGYIFSLTPHPLGNIAEISKAERVSCKLSKIVLDTVVSMLKDEKDIECNKKKAEAVRDEITRDPAKFAQYDLRQLLFIPETKVIRTSLGRADVVCVGPKCAQIVNDELVYPQICCHRCLSEFIFFCSSFFIFRDCDKCGCGRGKHERMMTRTELRKENVYRPTKAAVDMIVSHDEVIKNLNSCISESENRIEMCKSEVKQMLTICAKLNCFIYEKALVASADGDELQKDLQNRIETYKSVGANAGGSRALKDLIEIESEYTKLMDVAKGTSCDVNEVIHRQLYKLPMKGQQLKTAMDEEEKAEQQVTERKVIPLKWLFDRPTPRVVGIASQQARNQYDLC